MKIEVLGSGCVKCSRLEKNVRKAIEKKGVKADILKVTDPMEIADRGVMITPGLVIDGRVVSSGKVPSVDEIVTLL
ncbi:MAG: thioredoxin family protein [Thermoplasmatota archaeon]